ncbi:hypothetical protein FOCG_17262 [Fusarium oxysporum f. sp. radicis-lycopersici 26381]|nr:hypothetical protein FOCG_17262 [Fusarium oxysporum f. sp. radicis-lycopersici 26381]
MAEYNRQESEETIHQKTGCVRDQLKVFITQLNEKSESEPTVPGLSVAAVTDASERFKLWAGSVGAFLGPTRKLSLDYRLSGTPEIRYEILRQLEDILGATHDLLNIICGTRENRNITLSLAVEQEAASRPSAISPPLSESQMILEIISESISSLFRIGILVRKATSRDRFSQALQVSDLTFSKEADISYVRQKHPKLGQGWLSTRLGGAVAKRRQFIAYSRDHKSRLGGDESINDYSASRTEILSSKATTIAPCIDLRTQEEEEFDALSLVTASTMMDSSSLLRLPSLADLSREGEPFECPICFMLLSFQREKTWKAHVFHDLKAYVCTIGGSECGDLLFGDRDSWFDHELDHRAKYICSLCSQVGVTSRSNLQSHLATHGTFGDQQLKALEDAGRVSTYDLTAYDCPFCDEWADELKRKRDEQPHRVASVGACQDISVSTSRFKRHVATHQEQLAIFAIPRATRDEIVHGEGSTISSMSGNGPSRIAPDLEGQRSPLPLGSSEQGSTQNELEIMSETGSEKPPMLDRPAEDFPWENSDDEDPFSLLSQSQETEATGQTISKRRGHPGFLQTTARTPSPGPFHAAPAHLDYSALKHLNTSMTDYPKHDMESIDGKASLAPPPHQHPPDGICAVCWVHTETINPNQEFAKLSVLSTSSALSSDQRMESDLFQCSESDCKKWFGSNRDLNKHIRYTHDKPFCCEADENCLFKAGARRDLQRHYYVVHREYAKDKGYFQYLECDSCGAKFTRRDNLKRHQLEYHNT